MASCRSSCCDLNVLRQSSYSLCRYYSRATSGKGYLSRVTFENSGGICSIDAKRQCTGNSQPTSGSKSAGFADDDVEVEVVDNHNDNGSSNSMHEERIMSGAIFHSPLKTTNSFVLSGLVSNICCGSFSYHTHRHRHQNLCNDATGAGLSLSSFVFCGPQCGDGGFILKRQFHHSLPNTKTKTCCRCKHCLTPQPTVVYNTVLSSARCFSAGRKQSHTHYYDVLGLTAKASQKQIKSAYYDLSKKCHPDVARDKKSHLLFTEINEAYEVLGNIRKRRLYDKGMFSHRDQNERVYEEEDYTQSYREEAAQSPFERGSRPPPPTGRSKIYNFDEFYKQHYNDIRVRRKQEYEQFQHFKKMNDQRNEQSRRHVGHALLMPVCLSLIAMAILFNNQLYDCDRIQRKGEEKDR